MKATITLAALAFFNTLYAQSETKTGDAQKVLQQVLNRLNGISSVSYDYRRETRYYGDNYHHIANGSIFLSYTPESPTGLRFQAKDEKQDYIYNGSLVMILKKDMSIDTGTVPTTRQLENNSYLYHSLAMLRNLLPVVIGNDSIRKAVHDTLVNGDPLYCIELEGPTMYFGIFTGIYHFTATGLRRPYYLLVGKNDLLPRQFVTRYIRGEDDRDFVTMEYSNINTHPSAPPAASWDYNTYASVYHPVKKAEKKPVAGLGTLLPDSTLPSYTPAGTVGVSLSRYRGKVILLDFWFKSCGPCMEAMPHYKELQARLGAGFQLVTINIEDDVSDIRFFYNKYRPNYPMLFNGGKLFASLGLTGCPSSLLFDREGRLTKVFEGFSRDTIEKSVKLLLP